LYIRFNTLSINNLKHEKIFLFAVCLALLCISGKSQMKIATDGDVGINCTPGSEKLKVNGHLLIILAIMKPHFQFTGKMVMAHYLVFLARLI